MVLIYFTYFHVELINNNLTTLEVLDNERNNTTQKENPYNINA